MPETRYTVIIADDHPIFRKGLAEILSADSRLTIVAEAGTGNDALNLIIKHNPHLAVLDVHMPGLSGFSVAEALTEQNTGVKVIFLTMHDGHEYLTKAIEVGASGYLLKENAADELMECIGEVIAGRKYISPSMSQRPVPGSAGATPSPAAAVGTLTETERKVLSLIAQKKSSREIAAGLFISKKTVDNHRTNISAKLQLHGANSLLLFAIEHKDELNFPL